MKIDWLEVKYDAKKILFYSWFRPIKRVVNNIIMISQWIPVLWNNWDWDHGFLFEIMKYKLERMSRHHLADSFHLHNERYAKQIKTCAILLDRMIKNEYINTLYDEFDKAHPRLPSDTNIIPKRSEAAYKELDKIWKKEEYMYQQDLDLFLKYFKKYHKHWWA